MPAWKSLGGNLALAAVTTLICLEVLGAAIALTGVGPFFDQRKTEAALAKIKPEQYENFRATARHVEAVWQPPPSTTLTMTTCLGKTTTATFDQAGARNYSGFDAKRAEILLIGDSYTIGDEADDDETIAAYLHKDAGVMAANLGVAAYGSVQALLHAKAQRAKYPAARTIILGVMYENIRRNVNSQRFAFTRNESDIIAPRPYIKGGVIKLVPQAIFDGIDQFNRYTRETVRDDFWTVPPLGFPYSASLIGAAISRPMRTRSAAWIIKNLNRQYSIDFRDAEMSNALVIVSKEFVRWSASEGLQPIIAFIPQNKKDTTSADEWIKTKGQIPQLQNRLFNAAMPDIDWPRYNLKPNGDCHPSPYGYSRIAAFYASLLKQQASAR